MKKRKISIAMTILLVAVLAFSGLPVSAAGGKANASLKITNVKMSKPSGSVITKNETLRLIVSVETDADIGITSVGTQIHCAAGGFLYTSNHGLVKGSIKESNGKKTADYALNFTYNDVEESLGKPDAFPTTIKVEWFTVTDPEDNNWIYEPTIKKEDKSMNMRPTPSAWNYEFTVVDKVSTTPAKTETVKDTKVKEVKATEVKEAEKVTTTATSDKAVVSLVEKAVKSAKNGVIAPVKVTGVPVISVATSKEMQKAAGANAAKTLVNFDTVEQKSVAARITYGVDKLTKEFATGITTSSASAKAAKEKFEKYYSNKIMAIDFSQKTAMDTKAAIAVKSSLGAKDLVFYTYDAKTNQFIIIEKLAYTVDTNGYLRFEANPYGMILVSEGAFAKK